MIHPLELIKFKLFQWRCKSKIIKKLVISKHINKNKPNYKSSWIFKLKGSEMFYGGSGCITEEIEHERVFADKTYEEYGRIKMLKISKEHNIPIENITFIKDKKGKFNQKI